MQRAGVRVESALVFPAFLLPQSAGFFFSLRCLADVERAWREESQCLTFANPLVSPGPPMGKM